MTLKKKALENTVGKGLIEWCFMPLSTVFQSYHGDSSHSSCLSWVLPVLGWGSEASCPRTLPQKTQGIRCGSNSGPLIYKSNTLPLSHAGPRGKRRICWEPKRKIIILATFNLSSANALNLVMSKILSFGKGLTNQHQTWSKCDHKMSDEF